MQRCWAHKIRDVLSKVRAADQAEIKTDLHRIMHGRTRSAGRSAARRLADRWETIHPKAVACQCAHLVDLLTAIVIRASNSASR